MPLPANGNRLPFLGLLLAMLLWASSFVALKIAFRVYDPMVVIFGRMLVASLCFLGLWRWMRSGFAMLRQDIKPILFMALCEPCLYFIFEAMAIENTTASQAGIMAAMLPILVALAASWLLKERVSIHTWAGSLIALAGVCWLTLQAVPAREAPNPVLGNFLEFLAMVCATGYTITLRRLTQRLSPLFLTAMQAFVGSFFYFPLLFLPGTHLPVHFDPVAGGAVIYLGAVITLGAYGLYNYGMKHMPANRATAFVNLIPVFTVILGRLILEETFTWGQYLAAAMVIAGVWLSQRHSARKGRRLPVSSPDESPGRPRHAPGTGDRFAA